MPRTTWRPHTRHGELTNRSSLPDSVFAFPKQRKEPLTDADHVRNALARFDQVQDVSDEARELAFANIKKAAAYYDVEVAESRWEDLGKNPHTANPAQKKAAWTGGAVAMEPTRITPADARMHQSAGEPVHFVDSRSVKSWNESDLQIPGSIRVPPDQPEHYLREVPREGLVVTYCTWPNEGSSARVAQVMIENGWLDARPLLGGFEAWQRAGYPEERKNQAPQAERAA